MNNEQGEPGEASRSPDSKFEQALLKRMSFEFLREQRRARRWNVFFKLLAFAYVSIFIVLSLPRDSLDMSFGDDKVTALVDLQGVIAHGSEASADLIVSGLRKAFKHEKTAGVILRINSPGGSPVQSGYINDEIYRLKEKYPEIPFYAVIEDLCASGGYYVAAAADEIYADKASLVGSIGVRMGGFGFVDAIEKLGVERRVLTAGKNKGFLDPFEPLEEEHVAHVETMLKQIHEQFVNTVLKGRRDRLVDDPEIFSGLVWTGEKSLELGLIDAFGSSGYVAREIIGAKEIVDFTPKDYSFDALLKRGGTSLMARLLREQPFSW